MKSTIVRGDLPTRGHYEAVMTARYTPEIYHRLKIARVAVAGLGGLGSHIAVSLARLGVGSLLLVDFDRVELSNLNRQAYFLEHLGMPKTEALRDQLARVNPFIDVSVRTERVEDYRVASLFAGYDVLCEAFDRQEEKAMLVSAALSGLPGIRVVAASGMAGYASANTIRTAKRMKNLYVCGDDESCVDVGSDSGVSLMAPRVQICAGHQANMVLRLLLGQEEA